VTVGDEGEAISARAARDVGKRTTVTRTVKRGWRRIVLRQSATALAPGTYVVTATAVTADNRASAATKVKFWVLAARSR